MKKQISILFMITASLISIQADMPAYKIYTKSGKTADFKAIVKKAAKADVVFFGELHDNPIAHWLQLEITKVLFEKKGESLVLGAEMFEADDQPKLNEYLEGWISEKSFENETRLWPNYKTDYKPLVTFAKKNKLKFIATNIPRRYASFVARNGLDTLLNFPNEAKKFIAPLPVRYDPELPGYKNMEDMSEHGLNYIAESQAIKDATMAYFINENLHKNGLFIHYNGAYHSNDFEGIIWYLKQYNEKVNILTISTVSQDDISRLDEENKNLADFIIVVDEDMTTTY